MLLICPACSARYDVPASALPAAGRVVRCSDCRAEWLARPQALPEPAAPAAPAIPAAAGAEAHPPPLQPDAAEPAMASEDEAGTTEETAATADAPWHARGSDDEIAPASPEQTAHALALSIEEAPRARSGVGFLAGFATVTLLALLAVTVYLKQDEIGDAVPRLREPLDTYAALVDRWRTGIETLAADLRR